MIVPRIHERRVVAVFFALAFVVYTCVFPYIAAINNPNENVRVYMTMALVEQHTFKIDTIVERHGWTNDMARAPTKGTGELHYYSVKAPAVSYAGVPVYWAFTKIAPRFGHAVPTNATPPEEKTWWLRNTILVLRLFTIQLPCFAFLIGFERFLRGVSGDVVLRLCAVAAAGLGTNYLAYSMMFASHAPFACAAFASFAIVTRERALFPDAKQRRLSRAFWAGFFAGLATLLEYHALPVSAALAVYALFTFARPTRLVTFGAGAVLNALALMYFQWRCFGSPFTPGHKFSETESFRNILSTGLFGISAPKWIAFEGITVNTGFGFFGTSPFMWLGLLVIPFGLVWHRRATASRSTLVSSNVAWLSIMLLLFVTVSAAVNWRAGWAIGPRYLGAAPPFFAYGAVCALEQIAGDGRWRRTLVRALAGGAATASVVQSGVVSIVYNTLPEQFTRPLTQFAVPMLRVGFVPHHAGELFGWMAPTFFYVVVAALLLAVVVAALWPGGDRFPRWAARVVLAGACAWIALRPATSEAKPSEMICTTGNSCDSLAWAMHFFPNIWEPAARDRIAKLRLESQKPGEHPCTWVALSRMERILGWTTEADADAARAHGGPPGLCH